MCGINGIFGLDDNEKARSGILRMNDTLAHRGPDDGDIYVDKDIALGHKRLSIIDLSSAGKQPMTCDDRYIIVYNGELYNFKEIKDQIRDHQFTTKTDTEVVLAAFKKWGEECLLNFNGMYAFAVFDKAKKELFLARDRIGIKPLYYYCNENIFVFSSEIRAILSSGLIPRRIDKNGLVDFLRYQTVHAPNTILKNVSSLLPGHYIKFSNGNLKIKQYWAITGHIDESVADKSYGNICNDIYSLLQESINRRMMSDVPYGAFLSGGIDSSVIVGLMSRVSTKPVKTFSVVFNESKYSEAKYSRIIAEKFKTEHNEINLKIEDFAGMLPSALKALDHPSGDGPNTYIVSKVTKEAGITMALSGLGSDELFAGYEIFKRTLRLESMKWLNSIPFSVRNFLGHSLSAIKPGIQSGKLAQILRLPEICFHTAYPISRQAFSDHQIKQIVTNVNLPKNSVSELLEAQRSSELLTIPVLSKVTNAEMSSYMQNVLLRDTDQMSMAHSLEVRVPFLDHKLVEYVFSVPDKYKNPLTPKKLLIDSVGDLLPEEIVKRTKMGFILPWDEWMRNELKTFCEDQLKALAERALFSKETINALWSGFLKKDLKLSWLRIWILVVLGNWLKENSIES